MTTLELIRRASAPVAAAAMVLAMSTPVLAGPPAEQGRAPADRAAAMTEDDDTNDGGTPNNVADDGDDAHPSGKDRSVENGGSGNQGRAAHDPDDDGNGPDRHQPMPDGGLDQPDGAGGVDKADQDGNNGCGNDDDFEDDNEGWCLGREGAPGQQPDVEEVEETEVDDLDVEEEVGTTADETVDTVVGGAEVERELAPEAGDVEVLPAEVTRQPAPVAASAAAPADVEVLGDTVTRSLGALAADTGTSGATTLPRTGAGLLALAGFGAALAGIGGLVARLGRADRAA